MTVYMDPTVSCDINLFGFIHKANGGVGTFPSILLRLVDVELSGLDAR